MKKFLFGILSLAAAAMGLTVNGAAAASLDSVILGPVLYSQDEIRNRSLLYDDFDGVVDYEIFLYTDNPAPGGFPGLSDDARVKVSAPVDYPRSGQFFNPDPPEAVFPAGSTAPDAINAFRTPGDLVIKDASGSVLLSGVAEDYIMDQNSNTVRFLFDLGTNTLSGDALAVAVLTHTGITPDSGLFDASTDDLRLFQNAELDVFAATAVTPPAVPLPSGLPLLVSGLGAVLFLRRRQGLTGN